MIGLSPFGSKVYWTFFIGVAVLIGSAVAATASKSFLRDPADVNANFQEISPHATNPEQSE